MRYAVLPTEENPKGVIKDDPMVFHDLRHSFGGLAVSVWPLHDVQGYMGHADIQTTRIYVHHQPTATAAAELSSAVAATVSPRLDHRPKPTSIQRPRRPGDRPSTLQST